MAQDEILIWLALKRQAGNNDFFSVDNIKKNLCCGRSVWRSVARLNNWGYLDIKVVLLPRYKRYFRIKKKFVEQILIDFKSTRKGLKSSNYTNIYS